MPVEAVLIAGPAIDFNSLLSLTYKAIGPAALPLVLG